MSHPTPKPGFKANLGPPTDRLKLQVEGLGFGESYLAPPMILAVSFHSSFPLPVDSHYWGIINVPNRRGSGTDR